MSHFLERFTFLTRQGEPFAEKRVLITGGGIGLGKSMYMRVEFLAEPVDQINQLMSA
jgi:hypothetical protein